jgi:hypothetical protein
VEVEHRLKLLQQGGRIEWRRRNGVRRSHTQEQARKRDSTSEHVG